MRGLKRKRQGQPNSRSPVELLQGLRGILTALRATPIALRDLTQPPEVRRPPPSSEMAWAREETQVRSTFVHNIPLKYLKTPRQASSCCHCHITVIVPYRGQRNQALVQACLTLRKRISLSQQLNSTARPRSTSHTHQRAGWPSPHIKGAWPCSGASSGGDAKRARAGRGNAHLPGQEEAPGR